MPLPLPNGPYYPSLPAMLRKYDKLARKDAFGGATAAEFEAWRAAARSKLRALLGLELLENCELSPRVLSRTELPGGITREEILLQTEPDVWMPVSILAPAEFGANGRVFLCPPGHQGGGRYSVAGRSEWPLIKAAVERFNYDYGIELARQGHVALCPDCRGFGDRREADRQSADPEDVLNGTCYQLAHMAEPLGLTVIGMLVWDLQRLIDYVQLRGEWPVERLSCLGFSGGGMQTLWLTALDERVKLAVISGYLYGYKDSLLTLCGNCSCNYVPGLWRHYDMGDIASLIAPRPLVVQSCRADHLNGPRGLANVYEQMDIVRAAYGLFGAEGALYHDVCEGGHCFHMQNIPTAIEKTLANTAF